MFSLLQMAFSAELFAWGCSSLGGFELKDPGAVFGLVAGVERFVVGRAGLPHFPEDFEPALAEATQGAGMALAFGAMSAVVGLRPRAGFAAVVKFPRFDGQGGRSLGKETRHVQTSWQLQHGIPSAKRRPAFKQWSSSEGGSGRSRHQRQLSSIVAQ